MHGSTKQCQKTQPVNFKPPRGFAMPGYAAGASLQGRIVSFRKSKGHCGFLASALAIHPQDRMEEFAEWEVSNLNK